MTTTLESVDSRLADLEEEMTELRAFQDRERERKGLEYTMYEKELEDITETLGNVRTFPLPPPPFSLFLKSYLTSFLWELTLCTGYALLWENRWRMSATRRCTAPTSVERSLWSARSTLPFVPPPRTHLFSFPSLPKFSDLGTHPSWTLLLWQTN